MSGRTRRVAVAWASAAIAVAMAPCALAQDSFGGGRQPQPVQQPATYPQQPQYPQQPAYPQQPPASQSPAQPVSPVQPGYGPGSVGAGVEGQDFGVAPTQQLRPSAQLHGPTPTSIPGARVIDTASLQRLLQQGGGQVLLLHVLGGGMPLPGAVQAAPAGQGGGFDDPVQQQYAQFLQQATGGDHNRSIVTYCGGVQCWMSYNAALRAVKLGYRNVHWYRGGIEAWQQSGGAGVQQEGY